MKKHGSTIILVLILVIGLSLILYPSFANYWNSRTQSHTVAMYTEQVANFNTEEYDKLWSYAEIYNQSLTQRKNSYLLSEDQKAIYDLILDVTGTGVMGYIEIPSIKVLLPIYHGTSDDILNVAVGHLEWSSLPVGGESSHCVLSGHRGLPSAMLFTDLDHMKVGDYFMLNVLDETLTYEVDQILIVEPHETEALLIQEGKDLCTLVTCTPYGINSHRLLVRGHRVENNAQTQTVRVTADAVIVEKLVVAPFVLVPILLITLIILLIPKPKNNRRNVK